MSDTYTPKRDFALFGEKVRDFEKSDDVLNVVTKIMTDLDQNIGAYIGGKFISLWLREGEAQAADESDLDLLFVNQGDGYVDIVLREADGTPRDGGALEPLKTINLSDEIVEGYRVIFGVGEDGSEKRYEFVGGFYTLIDPLPIAPAASAARTRRMSRR